MNNTIMVSCTLLIQLYLIVANPLIKKDSDISLKQAIDDLNYTKKEVKNIEILVPKLYWYSNEKEWDISVEEMSCRATGTLSVFFSTAAFGNLDDVLKGRLIRLNRVLYSMSSQTCIILNNSKYNFTEALEDLLHFLKYKLK